MIIFLQTKPIDVIFLAVTAWFSDQSTIHNVSN